MHKRLINELEIGLTIAPDGPILIKAGEAGADPTRPDMEFVRTFVGGQETIYLPGSSLKGALRAHCERIARTVDSAQRRSQEKARLALAEEKPLSCNPLGNREHVKGGDAYACGQYFERKDVGGALGKMSWSARTAEIYKRSCFICQMFGHTSLAGHLRVEDGYPVGLPKDYESLPEREQRKVNANLTEERYGVAIDRIFGSVAVGPFQFEVATGGAFQTTLRLTNFTLAQVGLLALALRDLANGRLLIGFGKSRGLGRVTAEVSNVTLRYPAGALVSPVVQDVPVSIADSTQVYGVGCFLGLDGYGFPADDAVAVETVEYEEDGWGGVAASFTGEAVTALWQACARDRWATVVKVAP